MTDFALKKVLITGAASGIGRLLALDIANQGGRMILWDVDDAGLQMVKKEIEAKGGKASTQVCDLSSREEIQAAAAQTLDQHGAVDVLINNAGVVSGDFLLEIPDESVQRTIDVNLLAPIWTTRAFLQGMMDQGHGHIVTVASAAGMVGTAKQTDYAASKFGAVGFDESLRGELRHLGHRGIRTTVVCPYYINTGMFDGVRSRLSWFLPVLDPDKVVKAIVRGIRKNRSRVVLPRRVILLYAARLLPLVVLDHFLRWSGVMESMDQFRGHSRQPPRS